jgi:KaiC/GvpD/RAD55 family RecA-like ATPase
MAWGKQQSRASRRARHAIGPRHPGGPGAAADSTITLTRRANRGAAVRRLRRVQKMGEAPIDSARELYLGGANG